MLSFSLPTTGPPGGFPGYQILAATWRRHWNTGPYQNRVRGLVPKHGTRSEQKPERGKNKSWNRPREDPDRHPWRFIVGFQYNERPFFFLTGFQFSIRWDTNFDSNCVPLLVQDAFHFWFRMRSKIGTRSRTGFGLLPDLVPDLGTRSGTGFGYQILYQIWAPDLGRIDRPKTSGLSE